EPQRWRVLTFEGAFHGRTLATIAAGGQAKHLEGFGPKADGFDQVKFGDHDALRAAVTDETAAIMVEPVQGEGGIRPVPPQCMRGLRALCDEKGILLIFDEVQTGVGRTGHLFAHEASGISPDIMAIAKGIGGGFPVGACLATARAASGMTAGSHGSTFGGNPLAMAVGNAVLDVVLAPGFLEHVRRVTNVLKQTLHGVADTYPEIISQVRGEGLLMGLKCVVPNTEFQAALRNEHMLVVGGGDNTVRLLPPLVVTEAEIREAAEKLSHACAKLRDRSTAAKA
ncbi:MAG TPA: aspartate aminotransferase family protein, partial [Micropepsaceae bacterium]|nr:aspartate aminotransferase family protein [Micropepsaceae bacterium]